MGRPSSRAVSRAARQCSLKFSKNCNAETTESGVFFIRVTLHPASIAKNVFGYE
jgi:hypothetical protein